MKKKFYFKVLLRHENFFDPLHLPVVRKSQRIFYVTAKKYQFIKYKQGCPAQLIKNSNNGSQFYASFYSNTFFIERGRGWKKVKKQDHEKFMKSFGSAFLITFKLTHNTFHC